jgi:bifunctional non-homologous end joining protein LigD
MKPQGALLARPIEARDLMHATVRKAPFSDPEWLFEWKYDGFRCLTRKTGKRVELLSRKGNSLNTSFPDVAEAVAAVPGDFVWDGELTVDDPRGVPSFERLVIRAATSIDANVRVAALLHPARLYAFDMLAVRNRDLRGLPLLERKRYLRDAFEDNGTLVFASSVVEAGEWVFEQVQALGFEGMMAKRLSSSYRAGRSRDWLKIKYSGYGRPAALGIGVKWKRR